MDLEAWGSRAVHPMILHIFNESCPRILHKEYYTFNL